MLESDLAYISIKPVSCPSKQAASLVRHGFKRPLPRGYTLLPNATLVELLRLLTAVDLDGDAFGKVYEYFLVTLSPRRHG